MAENKPDIRFKKFTNDWEQRELEVISDFITKGATPTTYGFNWEEDGIPFFRNDSIKDNRFVFGEYSYISEEVNTALIRSEIHCDDILIAITGDIGKVGIVPKSIEKANINQHMAKVRILKDAYPYFVYQYLSREEMQRKYQKIKTGLSMPQLSLEQIRDTMVKLPSIEEQKQMGEYFYKLDNLITLHQCKYNKLLNIKKSMLEKMFPQNGKDVPEVRFKGFTDAWEQRKLSEVMKEFIVPMRDKPKEFGGSIPWTRIEDIEGKYLNGTLSEQYVSEETISKMNLKVIPKNSLIVSASATFGVVAIVTRDLITNQTFIGLVPNEEYDLHYLYTFFQTSFTRQYMREKSAGSTIFYISQNDFKNMIAVHPSLKEQKSIGDYFRNLDNLITLNQCKLDKLKTIKKSMLEKMFV